MLHVIMASVVMLSVVALATLYIYIYTGCYDEKTEREMSVDEMSSDDVTVDEMACYRLRLPQYWHRF
jgi:hypothetical protein